MTTPRPDTCVLETALFDLLNGVVEPAVRKSGWGSLRASPGSLIVLETIGRRSRRRFRNPLVATTIAGHTLLSTYRGQRSQWVKNLAAHPRVRYWTNGRPRAATALVFAPDRELPSTSSLPPVIRWVVAGLVPYTYLGWAFAVLVPAPAKRSPSSVKSIAPLAVGASG